MSRLGINNREGWELGKKEGKEKEKEGNLEWEMRRFRGTWDDKRKSFGCEKT